MSLFVMSAIEDEKNSAGSSKKNNKILWMSDIEEIQCEAPGMQQCSDCSCIWAEK